jgi:multidrug efflux system membrane fusion protein
MRYSSAILILVLLGAGCSNRAQQQAPPTVVPVVVATTVQKDIPIEVRVIGSVEAYSTVAVKSQVNGELKEIHFREGQDVKKGDLLFSIDPRQYQSDLRRAEANLAKDTAAGKQADANLARDEAQLRNAETEARRYERLVREGIMSREEGERVRANADSLAATVAADRAAIENTREAMRGDRAAIENAKLQLEYCTVRSPISGRTGNLIAYAGNLIKLNDTILVNINQISPLYVAFAVPEQQLAEIKRHMAGGKIRVGASAPGDVGPPAQGVLTFVNNAIDSATGTIRLKATFPNEPRRLWPGQFVNVAVTLTTQKGAVLVPSAAVQTGQAGTYVFVVRPDLSVESRPVVTSRTVGGDSVIEKGLTAGERVVTDGQLRLVPGRTRVEIRAAEGDQGARP